MNEDGQYDSVNQDIFDLEKELQKESFNSKKGGHLTKNLICEPDIEKDFHFYIAESQSS